RMGEPMYARRREWAHRVDFVPDEDRTVRVRDAVAIVQTRICENPAACVLDAEFSLGLGDKSVADDGVLGTVDGRLAEQCRSELCIAERILRNQLLVADNIARGRAVDG